MSPQQMAFQVMQLRGNFARSVRKKILTRESRRCHIQKEVAVPKP